jgi:hypothetical protein
MTRRRHVVVGSRKWRSHNIGLKMHFPDPATRRYARGYRRAFKARDMSPFRAGDTSPLHTRWVRLSANLFGKLC